MKNNKIIKQKIVRESEVQSTATCCKMSLIYCICTFVKELLDSILIILAVFVLWREIHTFFCKVACTKYYVFWFVD
jgi:hypothetical protein